MNIVVLLIIGIIGLIIGGLLGYFLKIKLVNKKAEEIISQAQQQAEIIKKDKLLEAKEHFLKLKQEFDETTKKKTAKLQKYEQKLQQFENTLLQRKEDLQKKLKQFELKKKELATIKENLLMQVEVVEKKKQELESVYKEQVEKLESIAGMTEEEAKKQLIESLKEEAKAEAENYIAEIIEETKLNAKEEAKKIIVRTIQRIGSEVATNHSIVVFPIDSDELKGRIIGREGRNIRALQEATGVDIIVDDTPETITISSYDPYRREIARLALQQLIADGRIHPSRIEEIIEKTKKQLEEEIFETGKRVCIELGIHNLHPELIRLVGKMKYRSSYGQNLLQHSIETAKICSLMAAELGLNSKLAKRAALLHDIGKVAENDLELPHALLGMKLAQKYGEKPEVCNAIGAHHDEIEMDNLISPLVQVCDAISGARPGARREVYQAYIKRLQELEQLALSYKGVTKAYAIQAGRELRVIVDSNIINDKESEILAYEIARKIKDTMTYPGQIKINVIREKRAIDYAK